MGMIVDCSTGETREETPEEEAVTQIWLDEQTQFLADQLAAGVNDPPWLKALLAVGTITQEQAVTIRTTL